MRSGLKSAAVALLLIAVTTVAVQTPQTDSARIAMEAARKKEVVDGDIDGAIDQYRLIIARYPEQRAVVADALLGLGVSYQKQGRSEARGVYEQILRDYSDQVAAANTARLLLSAMPAAQPSSFAVQRVADAGSRYYPPTAWILGPAYGTGCPTWADCSNPVGKNMAAEVNYDLDKLAQYDIPITFYHFDGPSWSTGECRWALGNPMIDRLRAGDIRALLHARGRCKSTNEFDGVYRQLGKTLGGFYVDEPATDADARTAIDFMQSVLPGNGEVVLKAYQSDGLQTDTGLSAHGHSAGVNDVSSNFGGLQQGIQRVLGKGTVLPAPFNEFTAYDMRGFPDEETYIRRLHWGAMQMVMEQDCHLDCDPWGSRYSPALIAAYRYYSWLHWELVPYLHSYDYQAYETGAPIFRESNPALFTTKLGEELFVAYVTQPGVTRLPVALPPGQWINYWNETQLFTGPSTIEYPVPLGREPIFIRNGALIPMQVKRDYTAHGTPLSADSLTVLVYPSGSSVFRYRAEKNWITFNSSLSGTRLTLNATPAPTQPVIYRIGRWAAAPTLVGINGATVTVNQGSGILKLTSEDAVNSSKANAWHYDPAAQRLIIKVFPAPGSVTVPSGNPSR